MNKQSDPTELFDPALFEQMEKQLEDPHFQLLMSLQEVIIEYHASSQNLLKRFLNQFENTITEFSQNSKKDSPLERG